MSVPQDINISIYATYTNYTLHKQAIIRKEIIQSMSALFTKMGSRKKVYQTIKLSLYNELCCRIP